MSLHPNTHNKTWNKHYPAFYFICLPWSLWLHSKLHGNVIYFVNVATSSTIKFCERDCNKLHLYNLLINRQYCVETANLNQPDVLHLAFRAWLTYITSTDGTFVLIPFLSISSVTTAQTNRATSTLYSDGLSAHAQRGTTPRAASYCTINALTLITWSGLRAKHRPISVLLILKSTTCNK